MPWVKLDDQFTDHPKVVAAGPLAGWLHVCGIVYSGRYLTDGFVPASMVPRLANWSGIATVQGMQDSDVDPEQLAIKLVECGLWEPVEGGYLIHDYLDYNPSAEQVKAERDAARERIQAAREKQERNQKGRFCSPEVRANNDRSSGEHRANNDRCSSEVRANIARSSPDVTPSPSPYPYPIEDTTTTTAPENCDETPQGPQEPPLQSLSLFAQVRGGLANSLDAQQIADLVHELEKHRLTLPRASPGADVSGDEWVVAAIKEANSARNSGHITANFVKAILDRWMAEGFRAKRRFGDGRHQTGSKPTGGGYDPAVSPEERERWEAAIRAAQARNAEDATG